MSYEKYIAWKRLTHSGKRSREEMSPEAQLEYDALGFGQEEVLMGSFDEAKLAYEEATGRSRPSSDA